MDLEEYKINGLKSSYILGNNMQQLQEENLMKMWYFQGFVPGPLLFIIYINDFPYTFKFSSIQHFLDDTNLILSDFSGKRLGKYIKGNLKLATEWISANKLSLNVSKTEIIIFKPKSKNITKILNSLWRGQEIQRNKKGKWCAYYQKFYVPKHLLRMMYYSLFNFHLI